MERNLNLKRHIQTGFWEHPRRTLRGLAFGTGIYTSGVFAASQGEVNGAVICAAVGTVASVASVTDCYLTGRRIAQGRFRRRDG